MGTGSVLCVREWDGCWRGTHLSAEPRPVTADSGRHVQNAVLVTSSSLALEAQDLEAKLRAKEAALVCVQALRARLGPRAQPPLSFPGAAYDTTSCFPGKSTNVQRDKPSTQNSQLIGCLRSVSVTAIIRHPSPGQQEGTHGMWGSLR